MNTFSEDLRKERVTRNISLSDIASKTHINLKYLEAIEQGSFDILPQTYIRAFLREYADVVGLPIAETIKKYDVMVVGKYSQEAGAIGGSGWSGTSPSLPDEPGKLKSAEVTEKELSKQRLIIWTIIGVPVVVAIAFLLNYALSGNDIATVQETPFQEVVREQEEENKPPAVDSSKEIAAATPVVSDSLTLQGTTTDSVWMSVVIDNNPPVEHLFPPHTSHVWHAKQNIILTLGNAGGINFTLNGKNIGTLGKRGAVLRNIPLGEETIQQKDSARKLQDQ
jgi:cytoskeletal protein RodZ